MKRYNKEGVVLRVAVVDDGGGAAAFSSILSWRRLVLSGQPTQTRPAAYSFFAVVFHGASKVAVHNIDDGGGRLTLHQRPVQRPGVEVLADRGWTDQDLAERVHRLDGPSLGDA
jgi:hypothetical protein